MRRRSPITVVLDGSGTFLEFALLFTFFAHAAAMISMATLLLPGMPGGGTADDAVRVAYIAGNPWAWRLGWIPWQITALSDLLLAAALLRTRWIPKVPAVVTLVVTVAAVVPDQAGQILWMTRGVELARTAAVAGDLGEYLRYEDWIFRMTAAWGATLYTLGALCWTWCFVRAGTWNRALTWFSAVLWTLFAFISIAPMAPPGARPSPAVISIGNALGFMLLQAWFVLVTELVVRRSRPDELHGRYAPWKHPRRGAAGSALALVGNSRFARRLGEALPSVRALSEIADVVYVNYLVEAARLERLVPPGLELQRLGPDGTYALFTFLTYRHGRLRPRFLGPLGRLCLSPVQTNWRIHVLDPASGDRGVYFVTNAITSVLYALFIRIVAEGMPLHLLGRGEVQRSAGGTLRLLLDPGEGSAPDADALLRPGGDRTLPEAWKLCFDDYAGMLAYCLPQERVLTTQPWRSRLTRLEITLGIPPESCQPLEGEVRSRAAAEIVGDAQPLCFYVPQVDFSFDGETYSSLRDRPR